MDLKMLSHKINTLEKAYPRGTCLARKPLLKSPQETKPSTKNGGHLAPSTELKVHTSNTALNPIGSNNFKSSRFSTHRRSFHHPHLERHLLKRMS